MYLVRAILVLSLFAVLLFLSISVGSADAKKSEGNYNSRVGVDICGDRLCEPGEELTVKEKLGYYLLSLVEMDDSTVIQQSRFLVMGVGGGAFQQSIGSSFGSGEVRLSDIRQSFSAIDVGRANAFAIPIDEKSMVKSGITAKSPIGKAFPSTPQINIAPKIDTVPLPERPASSVDTTVLAKIGTLDKNKFVRMLDNSNILPGPVDRNIAVDRPGLTSGTQVYCIVAPCPDSIPTFKVPRTLDTRLQVNCIIAPCPDDIFIPKTFPTESSGDAIYIIIPKGVNEKTAEPFVPQSLTVATGTTVIWKNEDDYKSGYLVASGNPHDRPNGIFKSTQLFLDDTWSFTFEKAGKYDYFEPNYPWMQGSVSVFDSLAILVPSEIELAAELEYNIPFSFIPTESEPEETDGIGITHLPQDTLTESTWVGAGFRPQPNTHLNNIFVDQEGKTYLISYEENKIAILNSDGQKITEFGSVCHMDYVINQDCIDPDGDGPLETGDGQIASPSAIAVDNEGKIFVTDTYNHRVVVFDSDGNFLFNFGEFGSGNAQFDSPTSMVSDGSKIFVVDKNNSRIQVFDTNGNFVSFLGGNQISNPKFLAIQNNSNFIYIQGSSSSVYTTDGDFVKNVVLYSSSGFSVSENGNIYMFSSSGLNNFKKVALLDENGNLLGKFGDHIHSAQGLFIQDPNSGTEKIYVGSSSCWTYPCSNVSFAIYELEQFVPPPEVNPIKIIDLSLYDDMRPTDVQATASKIYVAGGDKAKILVFDKDGNYISEIGTGPCDMLSNSLEGCIDPDGDGPLETGDGQIKYASSLIVDSNNRVYVADSGNRRILVFDENGNFEFKVGGLCNFNTNTLTGCIDPDGSGPLELGDGQFQFLMGIGVDDSGNIYGYNQYNRLQIFDLNGNFLSVHNCPANAMGYISDMFLKNGIFYVSMGSGFGIIDPSENCSNKISNAGHGELPGSFESYEPYSVAVNNFGEIFALEGNRIHISDTNGNYLAVFGTGGSEEGQFYTTNAGLDIDDEGKIYVADSGNKRIQIFWVTVD